MSVAAGKRKTPPKQESAKKRRKTEDICAIATTAPDDLKKFEMVKLCQDRRWKGFSKFNKVALLAFVRGKITEETTASLVILRNVRPFLKEMREKTEIVNDEDVFSLEAIPPTHLLRIRVNKFKIYQFDVESLMKYILSEGKFENPWTRQPFSDFDLKRLQSKFFKCFPQQQFMSFTLQGRLYMLNASTNLGSIRRSLMLERHQEREQERLVNYLEANCVTVFNLIIDTISDLPCLERDIVNCILLYIVNYHVPQLREHIQDLTSSSPARGRGYFCNTIVHVAATAFEFEESDIRRDMLLAVFQILDRSYRRTYRVILMSPSLVTAREHRSELFTV